MSKTYFKSRAFRLSLFFFVAPSLSVALATLGVFPAASSLPSSAMSEAAACRISVSNESPRQGETVEVSLSGEGASDQLTFNGKSYRLFGDGNDQTTLTALIAIPCLMKPGKYPIAAGGGTDCSCVLDVKPAWFGTQRLRLPPDKDNFTASPGEREAIDAAKKTLSEKKCWQSVFLRPVPGAPFSARFGLRRIVNGRLLPDYFHSGVDFRAAQGTPIRACAEGRVLVAHSGWRLHGNTVCIDHGRGVISIYIHMQKVGVKPGDVVESGQVIGTVGRTGRASGPHLHFGIYVNDVAANPEQWFKTRF